MVAVRGARAAPGRDNGLSEPREPLWAEGLARQPPPDDDDFFAPPPPPPAPAESPAGLNHAVVAIVLMGVVTALLALAIVTGPTDYTRQTVASRWEDIPMRCDTLRFAQDDRAFELFTCRAVGGGRLPPGVYRSPESLWSSDLTGQDAQGNVIRITRGGALTGFAVY